MIIVTGIIEVDAEDVWPVTTAAAKMIRATEAEPGCLSYRFSVDILKSNRFRLYEEWRDEAALEAHFRSPHMAEFRERLKDLRITRREIVKFERPEVQPL